MPKNTYTFPPATGCPDLWWEGKQDRPSFTVDTVPLAIFERIFPKEILGRLRPNVTNKIEAYHHGVTWTNRLILGDSLVVMNSLLELERLGGSVQMVYLDPPYGISYNSAFHIITPNVESEKVHAYHDQWTQGLQSYLSHLRDRLLLARELLTESGSIFVQIGAENAHLVRMLLDEIFGRENFVDMITIQKTSGFSSKTLPSISDYLLWSAKNKPQMKYRPLFSPKSIEDLNLNLYRFVEEENGTRRTLSKEERVNPRRIPAGARIYRIGDLTSQGATRGSSSQPFEFEGKTYVLGKNAHWKTTQAGLHNLAKIRRIQSTRSNIYYVRFLDDFPVKQLSNIWTDTGTGGYNDPKIYAVQTNTKVVQRCILMTTDPGDLVFDPTCGSGTTAVVAEQWGRRWISCDTSRIALFLARQRLMTATYPYYVLNNSQDGVKGGFQYKSVPHVKLRNLAFNESLKQELLYSDPIPDSTKNRVPGPFTVDKFAGMQESPENLVSNLIYHLQKDGISLPGDKQIAIENVKTSTKGAIRATGEVMQDSHLKKVAFSFNTPYNPLGPSQVTEIIADAGTEFDLVFFVGFHFLPETQTLIEALRDRSPQLALISINFVILLEDLLPSSGGNQMFAIVGRPAIEVKITPGEKRVHVEFQGIQVFNPLSGEFQIIPNNDVVAWFLDEDYDGHTFYIHQCGFLGRKNPWQKMQRQFRGILEDADLQVLRGTRSNTFPYHKGQKIAVKLFDSRGSEVSSVVTF